MTLTVNVKALEHAAWSLRKNKAAWSDPFRNRFGSAACTEQLQAVPEAVHSQFPRFLAAVHGLQLLQEVSQSARGHKPLGLQKVQQPSRAAAAWRYTCTPDGHQG